MDHGGSAVLTRSEPLRDPVPGRVGDAQARFRSFLSPPPPTRAFLRTFDICNVFLTESQRASFKLANTGRADPSFSLHVPFFFGLLDLLQNNAVFLCFMSSPRCFLCGLGQYASTVRQRHLILG